MASEREYLEKKTDAALRGILAGYCRGLHHISADTVLNICQVLAQRDPTLPDPYALFISLCRMYS